MKSILLAIFLSVMVLLGASPGFGFTGIGYSPFHYSGQSPEKGTPIPDDQFIADLQTISKKFQVIRTYGVDSKTRLDRVVPLANQYNPGLKVWLGVWEDGNYNGAANKTFLDTAISQANTYANVSAVVVGNECLPGDPIANPVSVNQLIADLKYVKARVKQGVLVTTCFTYGAASDNRGWQVASSGGCDVIMVNIYPFYGGVSINNNQAINNLNNAITSFAVRYSGKRIVTGETGWPSAPASAPINQAVPGLDNEATFTKQVIANGPQMGDIFLYDAFDEPWGPGGNAWGPHWGLWDQNRNPKFNW